MLERSPSRTPRFTVVVTVLLLVGLVFGSYGVAASSSTWDEVLLAQQEQFKTLLTVSEQFGETGAQLDFQLIDDAIAVGLDQTIAIEVEPCMLTWWAYARSSWEMAALAQRLVRAESGETYGYLMYSVGVLAALADYEAQSVDCP